MTLAELGSGTGVQVVHDRVAGRVRFRHPALVARNELVAAVTAALVVDTRLVLTGRLAVAAHLPVADRQESMNSRRDAYRGDYYSRALLGAMTPA